MTSMSLPTASSCRQSLVLLGRAQIGHQHLEDGRCLRLEDVPVNRPAVDGDGDAAAHRGPVLALKMPLTIASASMSFFDLADQVFDEIGVIPLMREPLLDALKRVSQARFPSIKADGAA